MKKNVYMYHIIWSSIITCIQVLFFLFLKYVSDYEWLVDAMTTTCMRVSFSYLATVQAYEIFSP